MSSAERTEINKTLLVVLALGALGGESDLEHIAVKAHEMFPGQFCWKSFPQFPDKDAVRVHLSEAKKSTAGALVTDIDLRKKQGTKGSPSKRFALSQAGIARAQQLSGELTAAVARGSNVGSAPRTHTYQRVVRPILDSAAYRQFLAGRSIQEIGRDAFVEAFKLFPDASSMAIASRLSRAASALVEMVPNEKGRIEEFIMEGRNEFGF